MAGLSNRIHVQNDPVNFVDPEGKFAFTAVAGAISLGYFVLQGIDVATHRYYQYQVAKELDRQILYTRQLLSETDKDDCARYQVLKERLEQLVLQQAALFEQAGAETILDAYQWAPGHITPHTSR